MLELKEGFIYHIKQDFFEKIGDTNLSFNKEGSNHSRPSLCILKDNKNEKVYWFSPISTKIEKYEKVIKNYEDYGKKCNKIVIGDIKGTKSAFVLQNAFPIIERYIDHTHHTEHNPTKIEDSLARYVTKSLKSLLVLHSKGKKVFYTDIIRMKKIMLDDLKSRG